MIQDYPETDLFKKHARVVATRGQELARHQDRETRNVYTIGGQDEMVYFIESGQVKLLMLSSEGRECLLAIHSSGDVFSELCLASLAGRL
jgi:CRP-like cAMP-binding protein